MDLVGSDKKENQIHSNLKPFGQPAAGERPCASHFRRERVTPRSRSIWIERCEHLNRKIWVLHKVFSYVRGGGREEVRERETLVITGVIRVGIFKAACFAYRRVLRTSHL